MIEVHPRLFVGNQLDFENHVRDGDKPREGWAVVHACKEPYHRDALGYTGRAAPKDSPEYLFAFRGDRLMLNIVDVDNVDFIRPELVQAAMTFITDSIGAGKQVLVHCNQGGSRGPSLALMWLRHAGHYDCEFMDGVSAFTAKYPAYAPALGVRDFVQRYWNEPLAA